MEKKKRKLKLKKRNLILIIIMVVLAILFIIEISYTHWILKGDYPLLKIDSSEDVKECYKNKSFLLSDCLYMMSFQESNSLRKVLSDLRYVGKEPNNYITLGDTYNETVYRGYNKNDEYEYKDFSSLSLCMQENRKCVLKYREGSNVLWRIVGVFNIEGKKYVKVVKNDYIDKLAFDVTNEDVNNGLGTNSFPDANISGFLNSLEINMEYTKELNWPLGTVDINSIGSMTASSWYDTERKEANKLCTNSSYCTDEIERKSAFMMRIGLLYPSDFGYAAKNIECYNKPINEWDNECKIDNWLNFGQDNIRYLTPVSSSDSNSYVVMYDRVLGFKESFAKAKAYVYPVMYLDYDIIIAGGYGTKEKPFVIERNE